MVTGTGVGTGTGGGTGTGMGTGTERFTGAEGTATVCPETRGISTEPAGLVGSGTTPAEGTGVAPSVGDAWVKPPDACRCCGGEAGLATNTAAATTLTVTAAAA